MTPVVAVEGKEASSICKPVLGCEKHVEQYLRPEGELPK
jgi:hypothetical protein